MDPLPPHEQTFLTSCNYGHQIEHSYMRHVHLRLANHTPLNLRTAHSKVAEKSEKDRPLEQFLEVRHN